MRLRRTLAAIRSGCGRRTPTWGAFALWYAREPTLRAGRAGPAREALAAAVALGRGQPLQGVGRHTGLAAEAVRLNEEFLTALETRVEADLAAGGGAELVGELENLVRDHPFRERLWSHLLVALYRSGRQADALAAYQRARRLLRDELGLEPGGELQRLERAILGQDPSLLGPAAGVRRRPPRPLRCAALRSGMR